MFLFKINSKSIYFGSILHIVLKLHQDHGGDFTQLEVWIKKGEVLYQITYTKKSQVETRVWKNSSLDSQN